MIKNLTSRVNAPKLDIQENTINVIDVDSLANYLKIANNFLSVEAREVVRYLIIHNDYPITLANSANSENALADFINRNSPRNEEEKNLLRNCKAVIKSNRILEIPVFQTPEQFKDIINGTISADEVIIDLNSEAGRNAVAKKYDPLVHKIVRQFVDKSGMSYEDLYSAGLYGLTYAMNKYGKRTDKSMASDEKITQYTFKQYAGQMIRVWVINEIRENSRTVRIPVSAQNDPNVIKGNNTISGDAGMSDDEDSKSLFDVINDFSADSAEKKMDAEDMQKYWKAIFDALADKFDPKILDIYCSFYGVNGHEKMKNKDIAAQYNVTPQNITYYCSKINNYMRTNKELWSKVNDLYELYQECLHDAESDGSHDPYIVTDMSSNADNWDLYSNYTVTDKSEDDDMNDDDPDNFLYKFNTWFKLNHSRHMSNILMKSVMDLDEIRSRLHIRELMNNVDALSLKLSALLKSFVNFMYDIIPQENSQDIDYADRIIRIGKVIGHDRISKMQESLNESLSQEAQRADDFLRSSDRKATQILIRYYCNHIDRIDSDKNELLLATESKKQISKIYTEIYGKEPDNIIEGLRSICSLIRKNDIKY